MQPHYPYGGRAWKKPQNIRHQSAVPARQVTTLGRWQAIFRSRYKTLKSITLHSLWALIAFVIGSVCHWSLCHRPPPRWKFRVLTTGSSDSWWILHREQHHQHCQMAWGLSTSAQRCYQQWPSGVPGFLSIYNQEMSLNSFAVYKSSSISWIANSPYVYSMEEYASKILVMKNTDL